MIFAEPGSTWWPLAWGPGLAAVGVALDLAGGQVVQVVLWLPVAVLFTLVSAVWVAARRRMRSVSLTSTTLRQGREELAVVDIDDIGEAGPAMGAVVLGGGWLVPNGTDGVPLRLRDGRSVLAWARDAGTLTTELRRLVGQVPEPDRRGPADAGPGGGPDRG